MNAAETIAVLKERLNRLDWASAEQVAKQFMTTLSESESPLVPGQGEMIMQMLRKKRRFGLMLEVGDTLIQTNRGSLKIKRLYAQGLIDTDELTAAVAVLKALIIESDGDMEENVEARGLLGRVHKQRYIAAATGRTEASRLHLEKAIAAYFEVYSTAADRLWHGINVVALILRGRRDNVELPITAEPLQIAAAILAAIESKDSEEHADMWDFGTAGEACIALGDNEAALKWLERYVSAPYADAFELASTLRQLEEVWQLDSQREPGASILPMLRAELLSRESGKLRLTKEDVAAGQQKISGGFYEKLFSADRFKTLKWYRTGLERCLVVARLGRDSTSGIGTGFAVEGQSLNSRWRDKLFLVTNAHVVSNDEDICRAYGAMRADETVVTFEGLGTEEYAVADIVWSSAPDQLDAAVLELEGADELKARLADVMVPIAKALPVIEDTARIYIIGYPGGGTLCVSLEDTLLLDHEAPRIHYRTPTEGGSSGSPVFNRQWQLIGLHHAGSPNMKRLHGDGTYEANEGIWIRSIAEAISASNQSKGDFIPG